MEIESEYFSNFHPVTNAKELLGKLSQNYKIAHFRPENRVRRFANFAIN